MKFEHHFAAPETDDKRENLLQLKLDIQHGLIDRQWSSHPEDIKATQWIKENAKDFAKVFDVMYERHPDLLDMYKEAPAVVLEIFAHELDQTHAPSK